MKIHIKTFIIFILFTGLNRKNAYSQSLSYLGIEQGLSNNTVTTIHKDKFGLMWFGTMDGLNRFDGYNFKIFKNKFGDSTSLPYDIITALNSDRAGNIWVGTQKGLAVLDSKTFQFSNIYYKSNTGVKCVDTKWVNAIKTDNKGNMYIGSAELGLLVYNEGIKAASQIPLINQSNQQTFKYSVTAIDVLDDNNSWLMIENVGLCYFSNKTKVVTILANTTQLSSCIKPDNKGNLWIGTNAGLFCFNIKANRLEKFELNNTLFSNCRISDILVDKNDVLWVSTNGDGIFVIDNKKNYHVLKQNRPETLSSDAIYTIYADEQDRKWIGTLRGGIDIIDNKKNQFLTYTHQPFNNNSLVNNFTFSFCEDAEKNIWIGTDGGGISIWHRKQNKFQNYVFKAPKGEELNTNRVPSIVKDKNQDIWVATFGSGVSKFNKTTSTFEKIPFQKNPKDNAVWKIYPAQNGDIWATCLRGFKPGNEGNRLFKYDNMQKTFIPAPFFVTEDIMSMIDADSDNLWLGGLTSLMHANKKNGIDKVIDFKTTVRALHKAKSGLLWIGTYGRGLISYDILSNRFKNYTEDKGLCNNKVLNIEEDSKGNIWVSTNNGISKLDPITGKIENFYSADGLQSNQFYFNAAACISTGEILFGGIKGFNIFNPDSIRQYHDFPPLILTSLSLANTSINTQSDLVSGSKNLYTIDHLRLPIDKSIISITYAALEYSLPEKIQYAYLLQGRDKTWNYVNSQRNINFSRLNEGDYVLKIKSTNAYGIWNPTEKQIFITVLPAWYRAWWAYCLYLASLAAGIYGYLFYHKKQTQLKYEVKLVKEVNEKKIAFFTNISHELRTPLTLIVNPIKDLLKSNGANLDLIDISSVYRNSRRLLSLVDQLLLFRSSENEIANFAPALLNLKEVCYEVFLCFTNEVKAKNISYQFICLHPNIMVYADREKLDIVLFNLLSNAIKFTPENGMVSVELATTRGFNQILVSDNGCGIPKDTGDKLFEKFYRLPHENEAVTQSGFGIGLFLAKKFTDIHNGHISYVSEGGKGTIFKLLLPMVDENMVHDSTNHQASNTLTLIKEMITDHDNEYPTELYNEKDYIQEILGGVVNEKSILLLIDDDLEMRNYIKHLLKDSYVIYEANNTDEGFEMILEQEPDIIVCDVIMQGTTGVEFCAKMKVSPSFNHIPIILLTGSSSPEIKLKGIECGADDYITKPFESDLLIARIKSLLKGRHTLKDYFFNEITLKNTPQKIPVDYSDFLTKCIGIIELHLNDENFALRTFTEEMAMSRSKLSRKIKLISGLSISEFIRYIRLRKAAELMIQTDLQIKEITFKVGLQDMKYFREQFYKLFEMNPSDFIKKYRKIFAPTATLNTNISAHKNKH